MIIEFKRANIRIDYKYDAYKSDLYEIICNFYILLKDDEYRNLASMEIVFKSDNLDFSKGNLQIIDSSKIFGKNNKQNKEIALFIKDSILEYTKKYFLEKIINLNDEILINNRKENYV